MAISHAKLSISLPKRLARQLELRSKKSGLSRCIASDLTRYYSVLEQEKKQLRNLFAERELGLFMAWWGSRLDGEKLESVESISKELTACIDSLPAQRDRKGLYQKVDGLTELGLLALADMLELALDDSSASTDELHTSAV